jgi:hypothetical protein
MALDRLNRIPKKRNLEKIKQISWSPSKAEEEKSLKYKQESYIPHIYGYEPKKKNGVRIGSQMQRKAQNRQKSKNQKRNVYEDLAEVYRS